MFQRSEHELDKKIREVRSSETERVDSSLIAAIVRECKKQKENYEVRSVAGSYAGSVAASLFAGSVAGSTIGSPRCSMRGAASLAGPCPPHHRQSSHLDTTDDGERAERRSKGVSAGKGGAGESQSSARHDAAAGRGFVVTGLPGMCSQAGPAEEGPLGPEHMPRGLPGPGSADTSQQMPLE